MRHGDHRLCLGSAQESGGSIAGLLDSVLEGKPTYMHSLGAGGHNELAEYRGQVGALSNGRRREEQRSLEYLFHAGLPRTGSNEPLSQLDGKGSAVVIKPATGGTGRAACLHPQARLGTPSCWASPTTRVGPDLPFCGYCEAVAVDKAVDNFGDKLRAMPSLAWKSGLTSDVAGSRFILVGRFWARSWMFHVEQRLAELAICGSGAAFKPE